MGEGGVAVMGVRFGLGFGVVCDVVVIGRRE